MRFRIGLTLVVLFGCQTSNPPPIGDCSDCVGPVLIAGGQAADASCGLTSATPACATCLEQSCCSVDQTCGNDPACVAIASCLSTCGDNDVAICEQYCIAQNDGGLTQYEALANCVEANCNIACY